MKFSKIHTVIFLAAFLSTLALFGIFRFSFTAEAPKNILLKQGFDFRRMQTENSDLNNLKIGEKLDISNLKNTQGLPPASTPNSDLLLFVLADPSCSACNFSKEMIQNIRRIADKLQIEYYCLYIVPRSENELKRFSETMGFKDFFLWSSDSLPPESLMKTVTPTHILTQKDGTILQFWFGSNQDENVRKIMSEQISSDLSLINDVYIAVTKNQKSP